MRIARIIENDIVNGDCGISVSLFMQGCPHRCHNCFNKETWDPNGGIEIKETEVIDKIINLINKNNINRNLSILGGEPLAEYNLMNTSNIIISIRNVYPNIKIYLWTGYTLEQLDKKNLFIEQILRNIDVLIDGRYVEELRDVSLKLRGSSNQRVLYKGKDF